METVIYNNLKKYRVYNGITQEILSEKIGYSVNLIRSIENKNKYPKYQIRSKICNFFNINQDQMFYKK